MRLFSVKASEGYRFGPTQLEFTEYAMLMASPAVHSMVSPFHPVRVEGSSEVRIRAFTGSETVL